MKQGQVLVDRLFVELRSALIPRDRRGTIFLKEKRVANNLCIQKEFRPKLHHSVLDNHATSVVI